MDFGMIFRDATTAGIPLIAFVIALVQWIKGFGLAGNAVRAVSMVVGLILGIGYQLSLAMPVGFAGWFATVVFGLALGLGASGLYDSATTATAER